VKKIAWVAALGLAALLCAGFAAAPAWGQTAEELWRKAQETQSYEAQIRYYTEYIRLRPESYAAYTNRGSAYGRRGLYDLAVADHTKAIQLKPDYMLAYSNRAAIYKRLRLLDLALADIAKVLQREPNHVFSLSNQAEIYLMKKLYLQALAAQEKVVRLAPEDSAANNFLAWFLATCPGPPSCRDGKRAVEIAIKSVRLRWDEYNLDTLAAAYAEAGRFEDAVKTQQQAIDLLRQKKAGEVRIASYEKRLNLYLQRKPYRDN